MDPKRSAGMLLAPGAGGSAAQCPPPAWRGQDEPASFPSLNQRLVEPEQAREMIRGRTVQAMPALPPHADRHCELDYVIRASVRPGYVPSTELLTRASPGSDFATDTCVRKAGNDPATGTRHLEELAFEVGGEQSVRDIRDKAAELTARGVRRVYAIFVKTGQVSLWSGDGFVDLDPESMIEDACLSRPLRVRALLDAAEADDAVARALVDKRNPVIEALVADSKRSAILAVLAARGITLRDEERARLAACRDPAVLDRWISAAAVRPSALAVLDA